MLECADETSGNVYTSGPVNSVRINKKSLRSSWGKVFNLILGFYFIATAASESSEEA